MEVNGLEVPCVAGVSLPKQVAAPSGAGGFVKAEAAAGAGSEGAAEFAEAHRKLLADQSIQFDFSEYKPPEMPEWLRWVFEFLGDNVETLKIGFWTIVVLAGLCVAYFLYLWARGQPWPWQRGPVEAAEGETWRPEEAPARALLREADALAAQGDYSEAAHLLLFRSIEEIDRRRPALVRPALTSRDIADASSIPAGPRGAFRSIVMMVERSLFGGRTLGEPDWRACRAAYEEFAFSAAWR